MSEARVLVVDDDSQILRAVRTTLQARGYAVATASNGETALTMLKEDVWDLVLLDLGLPGMGGQEVIERLRTWSEVPVMVLSVRDAQEDKVRALEAGADDYITKPFAAGELVARMRAVQRRSVPETTAPVLSFDGLELDLSRHLVSLSGESLHLTPTEYRLLEAMATRPGKLLTHTWLLNHVWGPGYEGEAHYLRVFVRQLRKKLKDDSTDPRWIATEPGIGYRWLVESKGSL
ncbi:MAG: two-component system, OmpR family, operon response regulator KdpE [Actinomycetota bacterium]|jgi:two-component system KDP operon response regulator KdpE|nr:two-component system, OmpR family, operon response regulator KdpE [Actinomycetota bacterium]